MVAKFLVVAVVVFLQYVVISAQRQWISPTTTAAEMRNPYTWYWPYAIAASEAYRDYYVNAQQISNQLYQQAYITQAFPWTYRPNGQQGSRYWGSYARYKYYTYMKQQRELQKQKLQQQIQAQQMEPQQMEPQKQQVQQFQPQNY